MINRANLEVSEIIQKNKSYAGVYILPRYTWATDGYRLMLVTNPRFSEDNFPATKDGEKPVKVNEMIVISKEDAEKVKKAIPKKFSMPIFKNAALLKPENGSVRFLTTNLQDEQIITAPKLNVKPPKLRSAFPRRKPTLSLMFNINLLAPLLNAISKVLCDSNIPVVKIDVWDEETPLRIKAKNESGQKVYALIMPIIES